MVQVLGVTYRIMVSVDVHHVVRILDDRLVGSFRARPGLEVVSNELGCGALMDVARTAARMGKVDWHPAERGWLRNIIRYWLTRRDARGMAVAFLRESIPGVRSNTPTYRVCRHFG
jgi:hypothetical protein